MMEWPSLNAPAPVSRRLARPLPGLAALAALALAAAIASLALGRGPGGWSLATGPLLADLLPWRGPHVAVAAAAGAMLAAAGFLLERVTANPLAGPEILGVGAGAGMGLTAVLLLVPAPSLPLRFTACALAAALMLALLLTIAAREKFGPERLLLAGAAAGAFSSAVLTAVIATGSRTAFDLIGWLSGSINGATPEQALFVVSSALVLLLPLPLARRWLDLLPLGGASAGALGLPVRRARSVLVLWAGLLTAAASLFVGPLSFVGLLGPHIARVMGFGRASLPAAMLAGAALLLVSDWLSRMAAFPYQLPLGLFATLIGGPYLVWMLAGGARQADA